MSLPFKALLAAVVVFGAVAWVAAAGVGGATGEPAAQTIARPARGAVVATTLPDGAPVFVVGHRDGDVSVLSAVDPHLQRLVVFCPDSRTFIEPGPVSRWDEYGHYLFGPAPTGLAPHQLSLQGDRIRVGRRLPPPDRTVGPVAVAERGTCVQHEGAGGIRHRGDDLPPLVAPDRLPRDGSFVRTTALLHLPAVGPPRVCRAAPAVTTCPPEAPAVLSPFFERSLVAGSVGHVRGTFLARSTPAGLAELAGPLSWTTTEGLRQRNAAPAAPNIGVAGRLEHVGDISGQGAAVVTFVDPVVTVEGVEERRSGSHPYSLSAHAQIGRSRAEQPTDYLTVQELAALVGGATQYQGAADLDHTGQIINLWIEPAPNRP